MTGFIEVEVDAGTAQARLNALADALDDLSPAMAAIAGHLESSTRQRFEAQRGPNGTAWIPSRRALEDGGRTLVDKGDLLGSIRGTSGDDFAAVGSEASAGAAAYAAIHQFGGRITPTVGKKALNTPFGPRAAVVIPARPFLGLDTEDIDEIDLIVTDFLGDALNGATP